MKSDATDAAYKANAAYALGTMGTDADGNVVSYFELDDDGNIKYDSDGNILEDSRVFAPNDVAVSYETYMRAYNGSSSKSNFKKSKTFFKLRELSIGYRLPKKYCTHIIKGAEAALVGQNLLIWTKGFKFSDPDVDTENINSPSVRYVGVNLKLNF